MQRLLIAVAALLLAVPAAGAAERRPSLRVAAEEPLTLAGRGFTPRAWVVVRVAPAREPAYARRLRAGAAGRFTIVFRQRELPLCGYTISAVGSDGSRARIREIPPPGTCGIIPAP